VDGAVFLLPEVPAMSPPSRSWKSERARVGALARCVKTGERSPDDPDLIEARRNLCALKLEEHMRLALAATPSMTDEQIKHLIALLNARGGRQ
jgi:hypothetical protein